MKTKHLTIMFTDIKGFTSKTSKSSRKQLHTLLELHDSLIIPVFKEYDGRIVKTIGDAFMVVFHSPTDAVLCGMKIQNVLAKHNKENPEDRLEVRVAVNSGEVTIKGQDVFGEAVNIAARLEGVAEAGDIYFTESVYLAMNKSEIPTAQVGYRRFKGIPEEVKVYKVLQETKPKGLTKLFKKEKLVERYHMPGKRNLFRILKWAGIAFVLLIILSQCTEKQSNNIDDITENLEREVTLLAEETTQFIRDGKEMQARKNIDELRALNRRIGNHPELTEVINKLQNFYNKKFK